MNQQCLNFLMTRRRFLTHTSAGLGMAAVASLCASKVAATQVRVPGALGSTHFTPRAKNVIYLFMAGGPSHVDLLDHKPALTARHGQQMPASVLGSQRVTLLTRNQGHFKTAATPYRFSRHGQSGQELSDLLPHLATCADDLCIVRSLYSEPINHDPAVPFR